MEIRLASSALDDLKAIQLYYHEQEVPDIGQKLVTTIIQGLERLKIHPKSGRVVPEFEAEHIRELIQPPFRVVYLLTKHEIVLIRVWRSERLLELPDDFNI